MKTQQETQVLTFNIQPEPPNLLFNGKWEDAKTNPPKDSMAYLCIVREITDLSVSTYHCICGYSFLDQRWSKPFVEHVDVIYWANLPQRPY